MNKIAVLIQKFNKNTGVREWALVSVSNQKVLKWFGKKKPSKDLVEKEENRVQMFKHMKKRGYCVDRKEVISRVVLKLKDEIEQASELGKEAFESGLKRVPAMDKKLMELIGKTKGELGFSTKLMGAWIKAWDKENLRKEVISKLNKVGMTLEEAGDIINFDLKINVDKATFQQKKIDKEQHRLLRKIYDSAPVKQLYTYSLDKFGFQVQNVRFDVEPYNLKIQKI